MPGSHSLQLPLNPYLPGTHGVHVRSKVEEPSKEAYSPSAQVLNCVHVAAFEAVLNVPVGQSTHDFVLGSINWPGVQTLQEVCPLRCWNCPTGQSRHKAMVVLSDA